MLKTFKFESSFSHMAFVRLPKTNDNMHPVAASMAYHSQRWFFLLPT